MRILQIFSLIPLLAASLLSAAELAWDQTEAKITLEPGATEARVTFTATNKGSEPVRIERVKTSCGCTGSILKNKLLEPGESAEVIGTFHKGKRTGLNRNKLEVYVEGSDTPVVALTMVVDIPIIIDASPRIVYWNPNTSKTPRTVTVTYNPDYIYELGDIEYDASLLSIERSEDALQPHQIKLSISPKSYDSMLRTNLTVKGTGKDGLVSETRIHVFVQP